MSAPRIGSCYALVLLGLVTCPPPAGAGEGPVARGAYCPIPKPGEKPGCQLPAREAYREFFTALDDQGALGEAAAGVEADVAAGPTSGNAYLALSSLAYGYYRLSQRAAAAPDVDPDVVRRLERWNALLGVAYDGARDDAHFRSAVEEAVADIRHRSPSVRLRCVDASGETAECDSTEAVMRGIDAAGSEVGIRGGLERLLERLVGERNP